MSNKIPPNKTDLDDDDDDFIALQYKIILLGDGAVGKTSIANRFTEDQFNNKYKQTVGVDFFIRKLNIPPKHNISLQIWDIGGQSIGSRMITNYITGAHAVLLCYDITNYESFANLEDWYRLVLKAFQGKDLPFTALIGNKNDLRHLCVVRIEQHMRFAEENNMSSFLMSAKSGDQVKLAFVKIASLLAGIVMPKHELEAQNVILPATIIDHQRNDGKVDDSKVEEYFKPQKSKCIIS